MQAISINITGCSVQFDTARAMAELLALPGNDFATLVAWNDKKGNIHSPQCLHCEIKGLPGWEVYGQNHDGRLRISVNNEDFVFIYS